MALTADGITVVDTMATAGKKSQIEGESGALPFFYSSNPGVKPARQEKKTK